jgi:nucleoside-diphosphate-sugar epimerase
VIQFLSNILHGKSIHLVDNGTQVRCFTYISDGIDALIKIIENNNVDGQIFNIGSPYNRCSIGELADKIIKLAQKYDRLKKSVANIKIISTNSNDYYGKSYQDVFCRVPSIKNAENLLGWKPVIDMNGLLTKTMDFYFA